MMKGPIELLLLVQMAAVAKQRLFFLHQELDFFSVVRVVTARTPYVVLQVSGTPKVAVLFAVLIAVQTTCADLARGGILESKNLDLVATALDVLLPRTMARFATVPLGAFLRI